MSSREAGARGNLINNSLLEDDDFIERILFCYPQIHEKYTDVKDKQLLWELIKMEIRMETIKYSKEKRISQD